MADLGWGWEVTEVNDNPPKKIFKNVPCLAVKVSVLSIFEIKSDVKYQSILVWVVSQINM